MRIRGWLVTLAAVAVAGVVLSGSSVLRGSSDDVAVDVSRADLVTALHAADARLAHIEADVAAIRFGTAGAVQTMTSGTTPSSPATRSSDANAEATHGPDSDATMAPAALRERGRVILACIDSLEHSGPLAWRSALPGLRAAIADFEYRTDMAELAAQQAPAELDDLVQSWLRDVTFQLERVSGPDRPTSDRGALNDALAALARTRDRFDALRGSGRETDVAAVHALAADVAALRRTVRALVRSSRMASPDAPG